MPEKILVPVDLGDPASLEDGLAAAEQIAEAGGGELNVLTVVPNFSMPVVGNYFPRDFADRAVEEARTSLKQAIAKTAKSPAAVKAHVAYGSIYDEILKAADRLGCDLIVMKSHRPEFADYLLGPNAARVVRHAKQSVYVVRT